MLTALALLGAAAPAPAAERAFSDRFSATDYGDVSIVGNATMTCPAAAANCLAARAGTAGGSDNSNNAYSMEYIDVDGDATTFSSSRADLSLPAGATVLFAGLYWGSDSAAPDSQRGTVKLDTPAAGGYANVTASQLDSSISEPTRYQGFADVTALVSAGGSGTYTVGNVTGTPSTADKYGGWGLVVAYRHAGSPRHNIVVFDGYQSVSGSNPSVTIPVSGLTTPPTGPVAASLGVVSYEGELGWTGDGMELDGTVLSDALNPSSNFHNSSVTRRGTRLTAKSPDYVNQLGFDADVVSADGILTPGSTSATVRMTSSLDVYLPGVLTFVTASETDPPETTIDSGPSGTTSDNTPSYSFSSDEAGSTFECRVDGGAWSPCSSPHTTAALTDGVHTFEVRAIDPADNVDPTPASRTITVDATAPQTMIDSGPSGLTVDNTPTFSFSSDDSGATFQCRVDGGVWSSCSSPHSTAPLTDGTHTFEVRAVDAIGNVDPTPATRTITVDTSPPQTTVVSGPSGATSDLTPTFTFASSEPGSTLECRIDGGEWFDCPATYTTPPLSEGEHTIEVRGTDAAGHVDPTPAVRTITIGAQGGSSTRPGPSTPADEGLGELPGSQVGTGSCVRIAGAGKYVRRRYAGIGLVRLRLISGAVVRPASAAAAILKAPRGRVRAVRYLLDGRRMRGGGAPSFRLRLRPKDFKGGSKHVLTAQVTPRRGRRRAIDVRFETLRCDSVLSSAQKRTPSGSWLMLRVDTVRALQQVVFEAPARMLPRPVPGRRVGRVRVHSKGGPPKTFQLAFGKDARFGALLATPGVTLERGKVIVTRLPAQTGIVKLKIYTERRSRPKALLRRGQSAKIRAQVVTAGEPQRLSYKLLGHGAKR